MRIALTGNPNSGKTTMFNALTGKNEKVGNWAGVTVEKKEGLLKKSLSNNSQQYIIVDLPGAYSMSPFTSEESITSSYVQNEKPDVIINIVDSTNLSRSLFFTTQLLEIGIPVVVALNKIDLTTKKCNKIDIKKLSNMLHCPVVETTAASKKGLRELISKVTNVYGKIQEAPYSEVNIYLSTKEEAETADKARFEFVNKVVETVETRKVQTNQLNKQDKIDSLLTNRWLGIPIFAVVMFLVFWISQAGPGVWIADLLVGWLELFQELINDLLSNSSPIIQAILVDGIIGGFIAVVGFLPLVMVMYFLIALLEDCGYMARVSVVLDPIFKKVGLSGKSVIPFVIGTGCAIPGVMACRTIKNEREKRATALLAPFMPCGAKLPVIALFAGAFFTKSTWVGPLMYFAGIVIIFLCALLVNLITGNNTKKSYFIIELPEYKIPDFWKAFKSMCSRGWSYVVKAGTIILLCNFVIQLLQSFTWQFEFLDYNSVIDGAYEYLKGLEELGTPLEGLALEAYWANINAQVAELATKSMLHDLGTPFGYFIAPIVGVAAWQLAAAALTGFIAKENVVGTLAVCFAIPNLISTSDLEIIGETTRVAETFGITSIAALAYLMFNLFTPPCFAAIGAMNSELNSKKWLFGALGLQIAVGYTVGFLVFFFGTLFTTKDFGQPWMPYLGWGVVLLATLIIILIIVRQQLKLKKVI